jgi:hypothetical protein
MILVVIIIINTPKQAQHNIKHRTAEFRRFHVDVTILIIRRVNSAKDSASSTPWRLRDVVDDRYAV